MQKKKRALPSVGNLHPGLLKAWGQVQVFLSTRATLAAAQVPRIPLARNGRCRISGVVNLSRRDKEIGQKPLLLVSSTTPIKIRKSLCGVLSLKTTFTLVPYHYPLTIRVLANRMRIPTTYSRHRLLPLLQILISLVASTPCSHYTHPCKVWYAAADHVSSAGRRALPVRASEVQIEGWVSIGLPRFGFFQLH